MRESMRIGSAFINLGAMPYIFVSDNYGPNIERYPFAVFASTTCIKPNSLHRNENLFNNCIRLRQFTASLCAWYWLHTYIYEKKWGHKE